MPPRNDQSGNQIKTEPGGEERITGLQRKKLRRGFPSRNKKNTDYSAMTAGDTVNLDIKRSNASPLTPKGEPRSPPPYGR